MKINHYTLKLKHYERKYERLLLEILSYGDERDTRNGKTFSLFSKRLMFDSSHIPLLNGRRIYYKGILGELCAFLRKPSNIKTFKALGCNYWDSWANENGDLNIDYGNSWLDYNGVNQLENVINLVRTDPTSRRIIMSGWRPDNIENLDLPCCHILYQWYVREYRGEKYLDMLWTQRSTDVMIGLPSDMVLAAALNQVVAGFASVNPGVVLMSLGDTHIYEEHIEGAREYLNREKEYQLISFKYVPVSPLDAIHPNHFYVGEYNPQAPIKFELKV